MLLYPVFVLGDEAEGALFRGAARPGEDDIAQFYIDTQREAAGARADFYAHAADLRRSFCKGFDSTFLLKQP